MFGMTQHLACRCHVMERESFEDDATAELLNNSFVSIKVDREERPDVDKVYVRVNRIYTALQPPVVIYRPSCNKCRHTNQNVSTFLLQQMLSGSLQNHLLATPKFECIIQMSCSTHKLPKSSSCRHSPSLLCRLLMLFRHTHTS